ncbi:hypothetical protein BU17DRAFT_69277 [Hysterangium stoloniferum]|nr:hypothetical protein BU17DRAFT_69277 [Hysterangium stoloniferum]
MDEESNPEATPLTPCLNTSWPFFLFMHDSIHLIFTPGAQSRCSLTSYGPGAPPLSLQGPYDVMLSVAPITFVSYCEGQFGLTPHLNTNGPSHSCMTASTSFSCLVENHAVHPAVMSYGPGAPLLSLQGPYDIMLSVTPRHNTSRPFFPFLLDCIHLIFTPGAQSRPFWNLLPASTLVGRSSHSCMTAFISFSPLVQNHAVH